jgi:hypothetical protein
MSWWITMRRSYEHGSFIEFIRHQPDGTFSPKWCPTGLNIYNGLADKHFVFEQGLDTILELMGVADETTLPHIGESGAAQIELSDAEKAEVRRLFPEDMEFFEAQCAGLFQQAV